jgi:hypothetical protein
MLADARIGAKLKAAQERGEVAGKWANQHARAAGIQPATLPELGIRSLRAPMKGIRLPARRQAVHSPNSDKDPE